MAQPSYAIGKRCYGCSQNQGVAHASTGYIACLNNDIYLSPAWDKRAHEHMEEHSLDVISPCGIETMESEQTTKVYMRKWRMINWLQRLRLAMRIIIGERPVVAHPIDVWQLGKIYGKATDGGSAFPVSRHIGNAVLIRKSAFERIGLSRTDVGGSDWDFQLRLVKRQAEKGDIQPSMIAGNVFVHHFIRATPANGT